MVLSLRHQNPGHSFGSFAQRMKCDNWHSSHCNGMTRQPHKKMFLKDCLVMDEKVDCWTRSMDKKMCRTKWNCIDDDRRLVHLECCHFGSFTPFKVSPKLWIMDPMKTKPAREKKIFIWAKSWQTKWNSIFIIYSIYTGRLTPLVAIVATSTPENGVEWNSNNQTKYTNTWSLQQLTNIDISITGQCIINGLCMALHMFV